MLSRPFLVHRQKTAIFDKYSEHNIMKKVLTLLALLACVTSFAAPKQYSVCSPNGKVAVSIDLTSGISYSVALDGAQLISPSEISMTLSDGTVYGGAAKLVKASTRSVRSTVPAVVYRKAEVQDNFNELTLRYKAFSVIFRAYDDGVAYRFVSASKVPFTVSSEQATFAFPKDWKAYIPYVAQNDEELSTQFHSSFENKYAHEKLSAFDKTHYAFLPLVVEACNGVKLCISESDLLHYPGMYLYNADGSTTLTGVYAPYPKNRVPEPGDRVISMYVDGVEDYIASCEPGCSFPWRLVAIAESEVQLMDNDLVWNLASPQDPEADFSWVKPGKVAWDWWNSWNIYGVDFESGVNTATYKYYIDFASKYGVEYVILDEGWSPGEAGDLRKVIPEIDLDELISYGASKGVGIILWAGFYPFQKDIEGICEYYAAKGVKGFKVDFMDSDDQGIPEFLERSAKAAAANHLMLDFHGIYKPTGLSRKYPNVVNYEGVYGLEQMKWGADPDQVNYDVTIPYIRLFAGPADYTQGAMRNACYDNVRPVSSEGMSPGTRCHQLAEYIVFFSPLNMLCDSPSNYLGEPECTGFIASVPTVWDETRAVEGKIGEYAVTARRSGDTWYVGGINNWEARDLHLDLTFLGDGDFQVVMFKDGVNADKAARDYKKVEAPLHDCHHLKVHMAPGGGFAAVITRK